VAFLRRHCALHDNILGSDAGVLVIRQVDGSLASDYGDRGFDGSSEQS
jgi:hypothetical protein